MSKPTFRRHARSRVDAAVHQLFGALDEPARAAFTQLIGVVRARANLLESPDGAVAVANLARRANDHTRAPEDWAGATGHPTYVVDDLARHLFARFREIAIPRFLASVWSGDATYDSRRTCYVAYVRGTPFRQLPMPIALTRRIEHIFLQTPDHVAFDLALRRAEVLGLGGSPALADAIAGTKLLEHFDDPDRWRIALAWLVRNERDVVLSQVSPLVDFLLANRIELRGRTWPSAMRLVSEWHRELAYAKFVTASTWPRSRWNGFTLGVPPSTKEPQPREWTIEELIDQDALRRESREMRHCVASYGASCLRRSSAIFSLRQRVGDAPAISVLTIEVKPATATIVQVRGRANALPSGWPLELVKQWAKREHLTISARM